VEGERIVPSIVDIYDLGAEWAEREIMELMDIVFEGLDTSKRLFLPENMINGQGHIIVTPMDKLIDDNQKKEAK
jgi:NADH:ubiquinone oxidoreductase subunit C